MRKIISTYLIISLILYPCFSFAGVDFSHPVCMYDENGNGNIEQNEYANCQSNYSCPVSGFTCNAEHKCIVKKDPQCPENTFLNVSIDKCQGDPDISCPANYNFNYKLDKCITSPICPGKGGYSTIRDRCEISYSPACLNGWSYVAKRDRCEKNITCPSPGAYNPSSNLCLTNYSISCPTGYTYNSARNRCETKPQCASGSYSPVRNRCETPPSGEKGYKCSLTGQTFSSLSSCSSVCKQTGSCSKKTKTTKVCKCDSSNYVVAEYCNSDACDANRCRYVWNGHYVGGAYDEYPVCPSSIGGYTKGKASSCYNGYFDHHYYYRSYYICHNEQKTVYSCNINGKDYSSLDECNNNCVNSGSCILFNTISCPSGFYYDKANNVCYMSSTCPSGGNFDPVNDVCYLSIKKKCPSGYTYSSTLDKCILSPECDPGVFDGVHDVCFTSFTPVCPSDYKYDSSKKVCYATASCPGGGNLDYSSDICIGNTKIDCPRYTEYSPSSNKCESLPVCEAGKYNTITNKCEQILDCNHLWTCPLPGGSQCLSFNLQNTYAAEQEFNATSADLRNYENDGRMTDQGCEDQVYIFNGMGQECLLAGIKTGFHNCCSHCDRKIKEELSSALNQYHMINVAYSVYKAVRVGYLAASVYSGIKTGVGISQSLHEAIVSTVGIHNAAGFEVVSAPTGSMIGGQATSMADAIKNGLTATFNPTAIAVSIAISLLVEEGLKIFMGGCNAQSVLTACYNQLGLCHFIGTYCKKKIPIIGCIQKAKTYCCFNSRLARIVQEQGRAQLKTLHGFGDAKHPSCRGFTPEEFQMLDFSKIDLSEWYQDIKTRNEKEIEENLKGNAEKFTKNAVNPGTP